MPPLLERRVRSACIGDTMNIKRTVVLLLIVFTAAFYAETEGLVSADPGIIYENDLIKVSFDAEGAKITGYIIKGYKNKDKEEYDLIPENTSIYPPELSAIAGIDPNAIKYSHSKEADRIIFTSIVDGIVISKVFEFTPGTYFMTLTVNARNDSSAPLGLNSFEIQWGPEISSKEISASMKKRYVSEIMFDGKKAKMNILGKRPSVRISDFKWFGYNSLYFAVVALKSEENISGEFFKAAVNRQVWFATRFPDFSVAPGEERSHSLKFFIGPKDSGILKAHDEEGLGLVRLINMGMFGFLTKFFIWLMKFLYGMIPNYGIAIIIITIILKLIFLPLSTSSIVSMKRMAELQPELQKLQKMYKENPQKMNEETMKLYKTFKVNPLSGCLPLLIQLPFFWGIYSAFSVSIELRGAPFFWWISDLSAPDTVFYIWKIPVNILPILMGVAMFLQQELQGTQHSQNQQTKYMKYLPFLFLIFFWNLPSGLVLYWLLNNVLTIIHTVLLNRKNENR